MDDRVASRLAVIKILHADDVALRREIDLDGIVPSEQRVPLYIAPIGPRAPDAGAAAFVNDLALPIGDPEAFPSVAPVEAAIRVQERSVDIRRIARVVEPRDDHFALIGHPIAVRVGKLPDAGRRRDVEAPIEPLRALRESHVIREDRAFVEDAVVVRVFEHQHAVGRRCFQ
jgi:hypothetical protein